MMGDSFSTIIKGVGGLYTVWQDNEFIQCVPRGHLRKDGLKPMVGDHCVVTDGAFGEILERKNSLVRPKVANVDAIVFVIAACNPKPDLMLLDKLIAAARVREITPVLLINKADQGDNEAIEIKNQYKNAIDNIFIMSLAEKSGDTVDDLKRALPVGVTVLAGQSGVGKSTLTNTLLEKSVMVTGELSRKTEKGKQTTRHAEMFMIEDGKFVIDSPGFSMFDVDSVGSSELQWYYPEIADHRGTCRFLDCSHTGEPDCFVTELLGAGIMNNMRYERYKAIYNELKEKEKNKYR